MKLALRVCSLFLCLLTAAFAQTFTGEVLDPSGASVPNAQIKLTGPGGFAGEATTDEMGKFTVGAVLPGKYALQVNSPGFAKRK